MHTWRKEKASFMEMTEQASSVIAPITFVAQEQGQHIPAPLVRIFTCGMLTLEVLKEVVSHDPPLGRYEVIPTQILRGRGAVPSLSLLKLLVSCPHRFATKDWLTTQMQHDVDERVQVRLDTTASYLRSMLCGIEGREDSDALRLQLVANLRNGRGSGPGYQLGAYPLLWLDSDALTWNVEQAARMERFGHSQEALPFWERAYQLASRGCYLPDEPFVDWAQDMRGNVEGALRQSVHALHRLYLAEHGEAGEEEAILLLRTYWQSHKTDEDALRPLMELLGKRERYQEAEAYYQQCVQALREEEQGQLPDERTSDLREFLRTKSLLRQQGTPSLLRYLPKQVPLFSSQHVSLFSHFTHSTQDMRRETSIHAEQTEGRLLTPLSRSRLIEMGGVGTGISLFAPTLDANFLADIKRVLHRPSSHLEEKDLTYLEQRTRYYWRDHWDATLPPLDLMPHVLEQVHIVTALLERSLPSSMRTRLCAILSQNVLLIGLCFYDLGQYETARAWCQLAGEAASEANTKTLQALAWGWDSLTWTYGTPFENRYEHALESALQANYWADLETDEAAQCWVQAILAEAYAHLNRKDACLETLAILRKRDGYSSGDFHHIHQFDAFLLDGYQGACLQHFYLPDRSDTRPFLEDAKDALQDALSASHVAPTCYAFYRADMAHVHARKGEIGIACEYAKRTIEAITTYTSATLRQRLTSLHTLLEPYRDTEEVKDLNMFLVPLLLPTWQSHL